MTDEKAQAEPAEATAAAVAEEEDAAVKGAAEESATAAAAGETAVEETVAEETAAGGEDAAEEETAVEAEATADEGSAEEETPPEVDTSPPKAPPRFTYECQRCGQYCSAVEGVPLTLQDLFNWQASGTLNSVVPHVGVDLTAGFPRLTLRSEEGSGCPLFDEANANCRLYHDLPLSCQAYPLAYTGEKYVVVDQKCQGLGKGEMTAAGLRTHRDAAQAEYRAKVVSGSVLPLLHGVLMGEMFEQSRRAMEAMTPEQKTELEQLFRDQS